MFANLVCIHTPSMPHLGNVCTDCGQERFWLFQTDPLPGLLPKASNETRMPWQGLAAPLPQRYLADRRRARLGNRGGAANVARSVGDGVIRTPPYVANPICPARHCDYLAGAQRRFRRGRMWSTAMWRGQPESPTTEQTPLQVPWPTLGEAFGAQPARRMPRARRKS